MMTAAVCQPGVAQWPVWSTTARVVVTDPDVLPQARSLVESLLRQVDAACSRFRPDSELATHPADGRPHRVGPLLAELVAAALTAARRSDGDVDPTMGGPLAALGYDRTITALRSHPATSTGAGPVRVGTVGTIGGAGAGAGGAGGAVAPVGTVGIRHPSVVAGAGSAAGAAGTVGGVGGVPVHIRPAPGWRQVGLDGHLLTVPVGVTLDLGATAKAFTADRAAHLIATYLRVGALVSLGGDIATAGAAPRGGWHVLVQDQPGDPACTVTLPPGAAIATSSTASRTWRRGGRLLHHVLDPRTCQPAARTWRSVSVVADTCLAANTASTAALVRGPAAPAWLRTLRTPACLVPTTGDPLTLNGWPTESPPSRPRHAARPSRPRLDGVPIGLGRDDVWSDRFRHEGVRS